MQGAEKLQNKIGMVSQMRTQELIVFREIKEDKILKNIVWLIEHYLEEEQDKNVLSTLLYECIHDFIEVAGHFGFYGNLWHCYLTNFLVNNENSYSIGCEIKGEIIGSINEAALHDFKIIKELFDYDFKDMLHTLSAPELEFILQYQPTKQESKVYNARVCMRICELAKKIKESKTPEEMKDILTCFYKEFGVGKLGLHKSFRVKQDGNSVEIVPILNMSHVYLDDLIGYNIAKEKLIANTKAFVNGKKANNCLLFGDAGTGKSSSIKAIANEYYADGLRIIELYKHQFNGLNDVISQIKNRNYKFIIYMDDLSFEDFEIEYKYLKAVIEGGLEKKPENVLIYATSNRRHLIRENYSDNNEGSEDMHAGDTIQEKLSLASRFGVTIYFGAPEKKEFQNIVTVLAKKHNIQMTQETLLLEANKWELSHGGMSGRSAQQFIDYLLGK